MLLEDQPGPDQSLCQALSVSLWQHPFSLSLGAAPHCFKAAKKEGCGGCFRCSACTAPCVHAVSICSPFLSGFWLTPAIVWL